MLCAAGGSATLPSSAIDFTAGSLPMSPVIKREPRLYVTHDHAQ